MSLFVKWSLFSRASLRAKLTIIIMLVTSVALGMTLVLNLIYTITAYRSDAVKEAVTIAKTVGGYSAGDVAFLDRLAAKETLAKLDSLPDVIHASLYDEQGRLFVSFRDANEALPVLSEINAVAEFRDNVLHVLEPVTFRGRHYGWMYLMVSTQSLETRITQYLTVVTLIVVFVLLLSVWFASKIQATVSVPILELANVALHVSSEDDYSVRVHPPSKDEIGYLYTGFNTMLERIGERTAALEDANAGLRHEIKERQRAQTALHEAQAEILRRQQEETERISVELKKAQDTLVRQTRLAAIGQLSASVAHELKNPLGTIWNAIYLLKTSQFMIDPESRRYLEMMEEEIRASNKIITDLMAMAKGRQPSKEDVNLGDVIEEAFQRTTLPPTIQWQYTSEPDPFTVWADRAQLLQVFSNLFSNARQAIPEGGTITVTARRLVDMDEIRVQDDGPGVRAESRSQLFEPLFTTKATGTGLGLTICRQVLERHGGTIELLEEADRSGALFRILLPVRVEQGRGVRL